MRKRSSISLRVLLAAALLFTASAHFVMPIRAAHAATLTSGSVTLSDPRPSETSVQYDIDFSNVTTSAIQCISIVFSDSSVGGSVPTGMDTTGATLDGSSDYIPTPGSWTEDAATNGTVELTFGTGETPASASGRTVVLTGIDNGSTADTAYFVQFNTYNNTDCSTSPVDTGVIALTFTDGQLVTVTVEPTLDFTINAVANAQTVNGDTTTVTTTSTTIPFGTIDSGTNSVAAHDLTLSTNATNGVTVYTRYTGQLTNDATDTIDNHSGTNASPTSFPAAGTEAFGYTTTDATLGTGTADRFTNPAGGYAAFTTTNAEVFYEPSTVDNVTVRAGYQVGIAGDTEAGTYTSTVIYTAIPTY